jgi:putative transposase
MPRFGDECLSVEWFRSRREAVAVIETWRQHYNEARPHSSLGYRTPAEFKQHNQLPQPAVF